jgi:hypothetical protein
MRSAIEKGCINAIHPCTIIADPLCGRYSGALYTAWPLSPRELPVWASSKLQKFSEKGWAEHRHDLVGKGMTPNEAYDDLYEQCFSEEMPTRASWLRKLAVVT